MKVFVVNLDREPKKKAYITKECERFGLNYEIYRAVDGHSLSEDFLKKNVLDYGNNFLTKGEIGCTLSHIRIYEKIIQEGLDYALILEDDAVLDDNINPLLAAFESQQNVIREGVYLLTGNFSYVENQCKSIASFNFYPIKQAFGTTGYIVTRQAAKKLVDFLLPVKFVADAFEAFHSIAGVRVYATIPHIVTTNDKDRVFSSLEQERLPLFEKREAYKSILLKTMKKERSLAVKLYACYWRFFIRKKEKIKTYPNF